jgi:hypothetical protein
MNAKVRQIEIDADTADLLEARAAALGISISELLADIARNEETLPADLADMRAVGLGPWSAETLEEDARRSSRSSNARAWASRWTRLKAGWRVGASRTSFRRQSREGCEADRLRTAVADQSRLAARTRRHGKTTSVTPPPCPSSCRPPPGPGRSRAPEGTSPTHVPPFRHWHACRSRR